MGNNRQYSRRLMTRAVPSSIGTSHPEGGCCSSAHSKAIGTRIKNGKMVARLCDEGRLCRENHRSHKSDRPRRNLFLVHLACLARRSHSLPRSIERWAEQIIHGGVNHTEVLSLGYFVCSTRVSKAPHQQQSSVPAPGLAEEPDDQKALAIPRGLADQ